MEFSYSALDDKVTTDSAVLESDIEISLLLLTWIEARKLWAFSGRLIYWTEAALSRMNRRLVIIFGTAAFNRRLSECVLPEVPAAADKTSTPDR